MPCPAVFRLRQDAPTIYQFHFPCLVAHGRYNAFQIGHNQAPRRHFQASIKMSNRFALYADLCNSLSFCGFCAFSRLIIGGSKPRTNQAARKRNKARRRDFFYGNIGTHRGQNKLLGCTTKQQCWLAPPANEIIVAVPVTCGMVVILRALGLFIEIWEIRSAAKGAVEILPAVLFWSIGSAGHASQVVDFHDNFG